MVGFWELIIFLNLRHARVYAEQTIGRAETHKAGDYKNDGQHQKHNAPPVVKISSKKQGSDNDGDDDAQHAVSYSHILFHGNKFWKL